MTTRPVAVRVSAATRLYGSCSRQASRMASETWSAILSGWPSVTDSEVNRKRSLNLEKLLPTWMRLTPSRWRGRAQQCVISMVIAAGRREQRYAAGGGLWAVNGEIRGVE